MGFKWATGQVGFACANCMRPKWACSKKFLSIILSLQCLYKHKTISKIYPFLNDWCLKKFYCTCIFFTPMSLFCLIFNNQAIKKLLQEQQFKILHTSSTRVVSDVGKNCSFIQFASLSILFYNSSQLLLKGFIGLSPKNFCLFH